MKKILLSFVAFVFATVCWGQSSLLATLSHEGNITTFYGAQAWKQAHAAAAHGDVITLSSGTFVATDITKAVTVRGAGMSIDSSMVVEPTIISGDFQIGIADSVSQHLTLEGIYSNHTIKYSNVKNAQFLKCRLNFVYASSGTSVLRDANFIHCRIADKLYLSNGSSASCVASVIEDIQSESSAGVFECQNCVIVFTNNINVYSSSFKNCVLKVGSYFLSSGNTAFNCVAFGTGNNYGPFYYTTGSNNRNFGSNYAAIFKTYTGASLNNLDSETFQLTEAAKTQYLGMDGTEVGIYGGSLPFDPVPSNPQITKCNVAAKSTADGKLSVDIEVKAAE